VISFGCETRVSCAALASNSSTSMRCGQRKELAFFRVVANDCRQVHCLPMVHGRHNLSVIGMALEILEQMRVVSSFFAKQRVAAESSRQHQDAVVTSTPRCSSNIRGGLRTRRCRTRKSWCRSRRRQCGLDAGICYDKSEAAKMLVQS